MQSGTDIMHDYLNSFMETNNIDKEYMKYDSKLKNLASRTEKWLSKVTEEEKETFLYLLSKFTYMSRFNIEDRLRKLYSKYKEIEPNFKDTIFLSVTSFGGIYNGAVNILECFEEAVDSEEFISKKNIAIDPLSFFDSFNLDSVKNIVFLDDIVGSGDTFIDFIYRISSQLPDLISGRNLYLFSLINLEKGMDKVNELSVDLEWDIKVINETVEGKIFDNLSIYPNQDIKKKHKKIIRKYEKVLIDKDENDEIYAMGYKKSSVMVAFYYNTPNNTLSTFWKENGDDWYPVFPRKKDHHKFKLKSENPFQEIREMKELKLKRKEFIKKQREKVRRGN
ncbi:hypothetical protein H7992_00645 [Sporosarcina sp. resist]|uniref:phosphoribosyltransferase-like protein n=1 Tax=Sporosarcina sp. resist TaxID=2762563 RepID=UPI00164D4CB1|nr:hypothetical protein [Sporosarcina sp. resist]QNK88339.1 hypothetical protein H7992_00645 [Sporosarcina sp. resist]